MAGVKETGASAVPSPSAAAVAQGLAAAKKSTEMAAGQVMIAEAAKRTAEFKEELAREQASEKKETETQKESEPRDTPELSRQSKWFGIEGKLLKEANLKWVLEMEQELWEAFLNWIPVEDQDLSGQLEELSKLYLALLDAILTHTTGEEQAVQLDRLEEVLSGKLNLLLDADVQELMKLLERTGQTEALRKVRSSVYQQTTGKSISYQAADKFYSRAKTASAGNTRYFMPESSESGQNMRSSVRNSMVSSGRSYGTVSMVASDEGMVYQRGKGGNIQINQEFDAQRKSGEIQRSQRNAALNHVKEGNRGGTVFSGGKSALTGRELTAANRFAEHITGSGNLFKNPGIQAKNEEVLGLLAAVTSMKGQIYSSNQNHALKVPMKSAVNQFVDYYLTQKGVYKVYNYTMDIYGRTRNPQKAIEEGLEYAYRLFLTKKEDTGYRQQSSYSEQAGFFQMLLRGQSPEADLRQGMRLLEQNWREFLTSIGESEKKGITLKMQKYSPWGALLEPEEIKKFQKGKMEKMILTEAIGVAVLLVVYLIYRLLF